MDMHEATKNRDKRFRYDKVYDELKKRIYEQTYIDGEKIPFERELCEEFSADRVTIRHALDILVKEGLLEKRAGVGSFAKLPSLKKPQSAALTRNLLFIMTKNSNDLNSNPTASNAELFYAIERVCREKSYSLFYAVLNEKNDLAKLINGNDFMGIMFASYVSRDVLDQCVQMRVPAICLNNRHEQMISIVPENDMGAYMAVKYLQNHGHEKIAILLGSSEYYSTVERYHGYASAMGDSGWQIAPHYILEGDWTFDGAREAVLRMLDRADADADDLPTALFCCSDMMAIGAMDALKERGLSIPRDISVMGFDNIQQSMHVYPRLTTIAVDVDLMAELAVEYISGLKGNSDNRKNYVILTPVSLEVRQSVRAIGNADIDSP